MRWGGVKVDAAKAPPRFTEPLDVQVEYLPRFLPLVALRRLFLLQGA